MTFAKRLGKLLAGGAVVCLGTDVSTLSGAGLKVALSACSSRNQAKCKPRGIYRTSIFGADKKANHEACAERHLPRLTGSFVSSPGKYLIPRVVGKSLTACLYVEHNSQVAHNVTFMRECINKTLCKLAQGPSRHVAEVAASTKRQYSNVGLGLTWSKPQKPSSDRAGYEQGLFQKTSQDLGSV